MSSTDFDIIEQDFLAPLGEPGAVRSSLKLCNWKPSPIGWDEVEQEPIYGAWTPEDGEKLDWWKFYHLKAMKHTKPEAERKDLSDGCVSKSFESAAFDSRDLVAHRKALVEILGMAVIAALDLKPEIPAPVPT